MLRIKTVFESGYVVTLYSISQWVSLMHYKGKIKNTLTAQDLQLAGENHLRLGKQLQNLHYPIPTEEFIDNEELYDTSFVGNNY